jgi:4-azaleucine resistance transporter AzlC
MKKVTPITEMTRGARLALPFAAADVLDGAAFGAIASGIGLGVVAPVAMSLVAFSGSAQFAALTVLGQHGGLASVVVAVVALNARYVVYGLSIAPALSRNRVKRLAQAQLLTDVSWGLAMHGERPNRGILVGAGFAELVGWTVGTAVGAVAGSFVGSYRSVGLDAALPAFFLCLLLERLGRGRRDLAEVALAAVAAVALAPVLPAGVPLVVVLVGAVVARAAR